MKILTGATSLALLLAASPVLAVEPELGANLGTSASEISQALGESGYEMTKYEREGREIEVYARKAARVVEVKIDPRSGEVYEVEQMNRGRDNDRSGYDDDRRDDDYGRRGDDS